MVLSRAPEILSASAWATLSEFTVSASPVTSRVGAAIKLESTASTLASASQVRA